jgi:predicted AlkP superfamily phosphohydrolase/phosphomutase
VKKNILIALILIGVAVAIVVVQPWPAGDRAGSLPLEPRVLLIGVDGMDWGRVERLVEEGRLPNLAGFQRDGASGVLRSIAPYRSPSIWTTIATGKTEEKHGVQGFLVDRGHTAVATPVSSNLRRAKALWQILNAADRTAGFIGWLVTWPVEEVDGYMVSSSFFRLLEWDRRETETDTHADRMAQAVHPPELLGEVAGFRVAADSVPVEDVARYLGTTDHFDDPEVQSLLAELTRIHASDLTKLALAEHLTRTVPTDLTAVYFRGVDLTCHTFWRHMEPEAWPWELSPEAVATFAPAIDRYYEQTDVIIGELLDLADESTTVIVCSDHGFAGHVGRADFEGEGATGFDMHREEGVVFVMGPGIAGGLEVADATVLDIGPTVLALLGLPVGRDMDGRVLTEIMKPELLELRPVVEIDTYESGEATEGQEPIPSPIDDEIREQLRSLGYIE